MIEQIILANLTQNEPFMRKVIPYLMTEYFTEPTTKTIFDVIQSYVVRYNLLPSKEAILIDLMDKEISDDVKDECEKMVDDLKPDQKTSSEWLINETEKFCKERAIYLGLTKSLEIIQNKEKKGGLGVGAIPNIMSAAIGLSFDSHIGHDYFDDAEKRWTFLHSEENKIPFDVEVLNKITRGGLPNGTLSIIIAGCVHPDTKIKIRYKPMEWIEKEISVGDINEMLCDYEIEVSSPDGWVKVNDFIDKGKWDEYVLTTENGFNVRCNENHLFKTTEGWMYSKDCVNKEYTYLTETGASKGHIIKSGDSIPIVDIQVDHPNHRYYTNGVESHNTNVGKSAIMCHMASANLKINKNVLYITMEMAEEKIAERIDANLIDMTLDEVHNLEMEDFLNRVNRVKKFSTGKVIIKQYPTKQANVANFRFLLSELKLKNNFVPDIIYVDYMNICNSFTMKGTKAPLDQQVVAISEELRGLAVEFNLPVVTATQFNREGFQKSDPTMGDTAQAFGVVFVGDFIIALVRTDELDASNQILCIQLKNRESNAAEMKRFVMGVNITKMQFFDVDNKDELLNEAKEAEIGKALFEGNTLDIKGNDFVGIF